MRSTNRFVSNFEDSQPLSSLPRFEVVLTRLLLGTPFAFVGYGIRENRAADDDDISWQHQHRPATSRFSNYFSEKFQLVVYLSKPKNLFFIVSTGTKH